MWTGASPSELRITDLTGSKPKLKGACEDVSPPTQLVSFFSLSSITPTPYHMNNGHNGLSGSSSSSLVMAEDDREVFHGLPPRPDTSAHHKRKRGPSDETGGERERDARYAQPEAYEEEEDAIVADEAPKPGSQVLPVATLPADYNGAPTDGLEYLFFVRWAQFALVHASKKCLLIVWFSRRDASALPVVTRVDNPYVLASAPVPPEAPVNGKMHSSIPTEDWRQKFEQRFLALRDVSESSLMFSLASS